MSASFEQKLVVIFDFDWSLVNENSDTYVFQVLQPDLICKIKELRKQFDWTSLMDFLVGSMMREYGITRKELAVCLRGIPYYEETFQALRQAKEAGAMVYILSDANEFYISEILNEFGLEETVDKIITNFASFETLESGHEILRIKPFHDPVNPHGCELCPANMCKGSCLRSIIADCGGRQSIERIIYVGDGGGDFCPVTLLSQNDIVCCRRDWTLHNMINSMSPALLAECAPWKCGSDILDTFECSFHSHINLEK